MESKRLLGCLPRSSLSNFSSSGRASLPDRPIRGRRFWLAPSSHQVVGTGSRRDRHGLCARDHDDPDPPGGSRGFLFRPASYLQLTHDAVVGSSAACPSGSEICAKIGVVFAFAARGRSTSRYSRSPTRCGTCVCTCIPGSTLPRSSSLCLAPCVLGAWVTVRLNGTITSKSRAHFLFCCPIAAVVFQRRKIRGRSHVTEASTRVIDQAWPWAPLLNKAAEAAPKS